MADISAVAQYMLEEHGSVKAIIEGGYTTDRAVIDAAMKIEEGKNAAALPSRFLEIIQAQDLTEVEKSTIGAFCQKFGTDTPTIFRLYKVFKATQR